jgi:hypothetical protein
MPLPRLARPASADAQSAPARPDPAQAVTKKTIFEEAAFYRIKLSEVADYLGTSLSPMHVHTVSGKVAEAIRTSIAAFEPA